MTSAAEGSAARAGATSARRAARSKATRGERCIVKAPPSEEIAQDEEEAVVVPPATPESLGLSGQEVQPRLDVQGVGEAVLALELDEVARRDRQVGDAAQLHRRVLGELGLDATDDRVAEAAVGQQVADQGRGVLL